MLLPLNAVIYPPSSSPLEIEWIVQFVKYVVLFVPKIKSVVPLINTFSIYWRPVKNSTVSWYPSKLAFLKINWSAWTSKAKALCSEYLAPKYWSNLSIEFQKLEIVNSSIITLCALSLTATVWVESVVWTLPDSSSKPNNESHSINVLSTPAPVIVRFAI